MVVGVAEQLSALVRRVLAPNPSMMTLSGTNSYLVGQDELVVIDPGPDSPEHVDALVSAASRVGRVAFSLVTHHHGDHLPAAIRLRERLGAPIAGHAELPGVDRRLADGEAVVVGGIAVQALATPGHTRDHVCYWLERERALFTGDLIAGAGTVIVGEGRDDLADYMRSLERVAGLDARVLLPGHGPVVEEAGRKIREYLDHRRRRERQIVGALKAGPAPVGALVERLYADVASELHAMAARNVRAHLYKLERDGRVTVGDDAWRLLDRGSTV